MDWKVFYDTQLGRAPRSVLLEALRARGGAAPGTALDLGCGEGTDTRHLLGDGWRVYAYDADPGAGPRVTAGLTADQLDRLTFTQVSFEELGELPQADLVYSGYALPFCDPDAFPDLWARIRSALGPSAVLAGELFGPHDDWAGRPGMNFHDRADVLRLLEGLTVQSLIEEDRPGQSAFGPKHWHVHHFIARPA